MVIGAFADRGDAEVCLSNLAEAGFTPAVISVVAKDPALASIGARARGPLQTMPIDAVWSALEAIGVAAADREFYRRTLDEGGVVIAITAKPGVNAAAREMLIDHHAAGLAAVVANPARRRRSRGSNAGVGKD